MAPIILVLIPAGKEYGLLLVLRGGLPEANTLFSCNINAKQTCIIITSCGIIKKKEKTQAENGVVFY